jgi:hypothetical protein
VTLASNLFRGADIATNLATTEGERAAVARLRYEVYVDELAKSGLALADDTPGVRDPNDERPMSYVHYVTVAGAVVGSLRADAYAPGDVPLELRERFSVDGLPEIDDVGISEIARFVIERSHRGSRAALALGLATYRHGVLDLGFHVSFSMAAPGLVHSYRRFGFQPYAARLIETPDGVRIPLIAIWSDARRLASLGSPLAAMAALHFGPGRRKPLDTRPFADRLEERNAPLRSSAELVREPLEQMFDDPPPLFTGLSSKVLRWLSREAMVLDAGRGVLLLRKGLVDRELFVILDGALEVRPVGREPTRLGPGQPVGEVALFSSEGRRSADVVVADDATILVLRRRAIERMLDDVPAAGARFVVNLARQMADRAVP